MRQGLTLSPADRSTLAALMGEESVSCYEHLVLDHIESTGKKYKSLAATIRVWWRRDQQKRGVVTVTAAKPKETPAERLKRATAILADQIRTRNHWLSDCKTHRHGRACGFGPEYAGCRYRIENDRPLSTLAEIVERMRGNENE